MGGAAVDQRADAASTRHDDVFSPAASARLLAERIPRAHAELTQGARHAYFHEFQTVASPLVTDFLGAL